MPVDQILTAPTDIAVVLSAINERLAVNEEKFEAVDVRSGRAGLSLYHYACAAFFQSEEHFIKANKYLEDCFTALNTGYISRILYREIAELGWCIEICKKMGQYTDDTNEILNDFDDILYQQMLDELATKNFDPATGALGYGFYFLNRLSSNPAIEGIVHELATALINLSHKDESGRYWKSKLNDDDSIYLGISHGSAAILVFLDKAVRAGIGIDCEQLFKEATDYIVNKENGQGPVFFPVIVGEGSNYSIFANNWCYGDPGTLYGLLQGALFLDDDRLKEYVLDKYTVVTQRKNDNVYLVAGYGLLYGNSGLAMLYRKCYDQTGVNLFLTAYREQIELLLVNFNPCDEFLGYAGYWNQELEITNYCFSEGMIGIALTLMAHKDPSFSQYFAPFFYV